MDANAAEGALISSGIDREATNVEARPQPCQPKRSKLPYSQIPLSHQPNNSPPKVNLKQKCELNPRKIQTFQLDKKILVSALTNPKL